MSPFCKVTVLLLGDIRDPKSCQLIAESDPDLTPEQWMALGQALCNTAGMGACAHIVINEEDGKTTAQNVTGRLFEGPGTEQ